MRVSNYLFSFFVNKIKHNNDKQFINGFTINY